MSVVLAVEVGNSRAKFGLFEASQTDRPVVVHLTTVPLDPETNVAAALQLWLFERQLTPDTCILAGSNPPARDKMLVDWPAGIGAPRVVRKPSDIPVKLDVDPSTIGLDRLLTAFAAIREFSPSCPVITVDSGTATTISLVTKDGVFRGGAILPGLRLSARALHEYTARLPLLDTDRIADRVTETIAPVPGRNTHEAMTAGLFWGQLGAIREIRRRLENSAEARFAQTGDVQCLVTGGGGRQLCDHLAPCRYIDCLALHGLAILATEDH